MNKLSRIFPVIICLILSFTLIFQCSAIQEELDFLLFSSNLADSSNVNVKTYARTSDSFYSGASSNVTIQHFTHTEDSFDIDQNTPELTSHLKFTMNKDLITTTTGVRLFCEFNWDSTSNPFLDPDLAESQEYIEISLVYYIPVIEEYCYDFSQFELNFYDSYPYSESHMSIESEYMRILPLNYSANGIMLPEYKGFMFNFYYKAKDLNSILLMLDGMQASSFRMKAVIALKYLPLQTTSGNSLDWNIYFSDLQVSYTPIQHVTNMLFDDYSHVIVNALDEMEYNFELYLNQIFYEELTDKFDSYETFYNHIKDSYPDYTNNNMSDYEKLKYYRDITHDFFNNQGAFNVDNFGGTDTFGAVDYIVTKILDSGLYIYFTTTLVITIAFYVLGKVSKAN